MKFAALRSVAMRQAAALLSGTLFAQLVTFSASPLLSRLYSPIEFGVYGLFVSITVIIASIAAGRYELAIVLPDDKTESAHVAFLGVLITSLVGLFLVVALALTWDSVIALLRNPGIDRWLWLVPVHVMFVSINQILAQLNLRFNEFGIQAKIRVIQSIMAAGFGVTFSALNFGPGGLILGVVAAQILVNVIQVGRGLGCYFPYVKSFGWSRCSMLGRKYRKFPIYQVPSTLIETLTSYIPIFVLSPFFGAEAAGYFFMAQSIVRVPVVFLSKAVGEVFRQRASRQFNSKGNCRDLYVKTFWILIGVGAPGFGILAYVAPDLFSIVLGERWRDAGVYAQFMCVMFLMQFVSSPLSAVFIVTQRLGHNLLMQVGTFLVVGTSFLVGVLYLNSPLETVTLYSAAYALRYVVQLRLSFKYSGSKA
ncbi:MAG: hypothetical protein E6P95_00550 [Candidatus Moraniibacteriota bacterium]|nr:MAG: hypothetical protein E6P95_00550 [Candidatus Moranbacteria bacterium]